MAVDSSTGGGASTDMDVQPVTRTRAHEEVARQLRDLIHQDVLRPGTRLLPERDLARRFRVSRATIRQALSALHSAGLVDSRVGTGTFVREDARASEPNVATALRVARASLADQLGLRRLIEPQVACLAAAHAGDDDLDALERYVALQRERLHDRVPFVDEDSAFHLAIARATDNDLLVRMVGGIHELLRESRERSQRSPGGMERSLAGHQKILDAIRNSDSSAAHDAMLDHISDVERLSLRTLPSSPA